MKKTFDEDIPGLAHEVTFCDDCGLPIRDRSLTGMYDLKKEDHKCPPWLLK